MEIKVRANTASDNNCLSQLAIKNPRMPNQARLRCYTKWLMVNILEPLMFYYCDKLQQMITKKMQVGFMTPGPVAKDGVP